MQRRRQAILGFVLGVAAVFSQVSGMAEPERASKGGANYVRRSRLTEHAADLLKAMGDRLELAGKERLLLEGSLSLPLLSRTFPFVLVRENQGLLYLSFGDERASTQIRFDGTRLGVSGRLNTGLESGLAGLFVDGMVERFFFDQMRGAGTRYLGRHFRLAGGSYEVYLVSAPGRVGANADASRVYFFNGLNRMLECVKYTDGSNEVQILHTVWKSFGGQMVPTRITLLWNGVVIADINITAAQTGPAADDGLFSVK